MMADELISTFNKWVVIGDVSNKEKYASKILNKFKNSGYEVAGIHPAGGLDVYKSIKEVPFKIEAIDLCINHYQGLKYLEEANSLGIKNILIQPGAESEGIISYCEQNGINAVRGCALIELGKLIL